MQPKQLPHNAVLSEAPSGDTTLRMPFLRALALCSAAATAGIVGVSAWDTTHAEQAPKGSTSEKVTHTTDFSTRISVLIMLLCVALRIRRGGGHDSNAGVRVPRDTQELRDAHPEGLSY